MARSEQIEQYSPTVDVQLKRALLSVSDKRGIVEFAIGLSELGVEIISTGGTAKELDRAGVPARKIHEFTGFPEIMDGRVKTLHPRLYAGLLARRDEPGHMASIEEHHIELVDLVCVNLYPFEQMAMRMAPSERELLEYIDIGGPTLIRAAAKNFPFSGVVVKPESYDAILDELRDSDCRLSLPTRAALAGEAFAYTARYDTQIARWFSSKQEGFPALLLSAYEKWADLPYGENPHQRGAYYAQVGARSHLLAAVEQLSGKSLSYNNLLDLDAARQLIGDFELPTCAIIKHNNPCGCAVGESGVDAYKRALASDPISAFGGTIATNCSVTESMAQEISKQFAEVLIAPEYKPAALEYLQEHKPKLRILCDRERRRPVFTEPEVRQVTGGILVQDHDANLTDRERMEVVTKRRPTEEEWNQLLLAWSVCKHVRSNAIVLTKGLATVGIGAGQMSRVDSVRLAVEKSTADSLEQAAMASDAFFPFPDGVQIATDAGITAIIQPGGSIRDDEVIAAANAADATMVFTGRRHFKH